MLGQPAWQEVLGVSTATDLEQVYDTITQWERLPNRVIELAVHDGLKEGDKRARRPAGQQPAVQTESSEFIGASGVLKLLKKQLRPWLKELDRQDPRQPDHRPRVYRTRSLLLADVLRWMLGLTSTEELRRKLKQHPHLAGAVNFTPGAIPSKATFSRRRLVVPLDDLKAILQALVVVLVRGKVIDGRAWVVDLTRVPTHSSVSKTYAESANGKSDPQAARFPCGYPDNDGGLQFGYCLVWIVDFKSELPLALVFGAGNAQDSPLALPLLRQACTQQPTLAQRCQYFIGDGSYDTIDFFKFALHRLRAIAAVSKNPRRAADPTADLATDAYCILRRGTLWYQALFHCRTSVERTNSWVKLTFREASSITSIGGGRRWSDAFCSRPLPCWPWPGWRSKPDTRTKSARPEPGSVSTNPPAPLAWTEPDRVITLPVGHLCPGVGLMVGWEKLTWLRGLQPSQKAQESRLAIRLCL